MFKKLLTIFIICVTVLGLFGCSGGSVNTNGNNQNQTCVHNYEDSILSDSTCSKEGLKLSVCSKCGDEKETAIEKKQHSYISEITTESTCYVEGSATHVCSVCGDSYTTSIDKTNDHIYSRNNVCKICGKGSNITLNMTSQEQEEAKKVNYARITVENSGNGFILWSRAVYQQSNKSEKVVKIPYIIDIVIKNINGQTVYSAVEKMDMSDYSAENPDEIIMCPLEIPYNKLSNVNVKLDKIYVTMYAPGCFYRGEGEMLVPIMILYPELPLINKYSGSINIKKIKHECISKNWNIFHISGFRMLESSDVDDLLNDQGKLCFVKFGIYDMNDNLIDSKSAMIDTLKYFEEFNDVGMFTFAELELGKIYKLKFLDK